jgi:site-specific DNA-cytosine methylase
MHGLNYFLEVSPAVKVGSGLGIPSPPAVAFRKSQRARSTTDCETWVEAEQSNTLNQFDTGERDTHAVLQEIPDILKPPEDQVCIECGNDLSVADGWHCLECITNDPKMPTMIESHVEPRMTVRRLTPRECERLQGFPDDWTLIPWRGKRAEDCPDGNRYKALGNSMAVNCMEWIGERIAAYEETHR